jgi:hypothetical protein
MRDTSSLSVAETAFALLTCRPAPLIFDARPIPGLPDRTLPLDELGDAGRPESRAVGAACRLLLAGAACAVARARTFA